MPKTDFDWKLPLWFWALAAIYIAWCAWIGTEDIYQHVTGRVFWPISQ